MWCIHICLIDQSSFPDPQGSADRMLKTTGLRQGCSPFWTRCGVWAGLWARSDPMHQVWALFCPYPVLPVGIRFWAAAHDFYPVLAELPLDSQGALWAGWCHVRVQIRLTGWSLSMLGLRHGGSPNTIGDKWKFCHWLQWFQDFTNDLHAQTILGAVAKEGHLHSPWQPSWPYLFIAKKPLCKGKFISQLLYSNKVDL